MQETTLGSIDRSITKKDLNRLLKLIFDPLKKSVESLDMIEVESKIKDKKKNVKESSKKETAEKTNKKTLQSVEVVNSDRNYFVQHLINLVHNAVGLRQSNPPFDCHPDILKKYLGQTYNLTKFFPSSDPNQVVVKFLVKEASLLTRKDEKLDPYFKVLGPGAKSREKPVYKSKHIDNQNKPKWNELFYVPVSRKHIFDKQRMRIEIWDYDAKSVCAALKDFGKVRTCRRLGKTSKDLFEVMFSCCYPKIEIDDHIGMCFLDFDEIPASGINLTKNVFYRNDDKGTIRMSLDWGSLIKDKKDKLIVILMHMKLYSSCLNLHLEQLRDDTVKDLKIEKVNYILLFYKTELTLINQNRIRGCMTFYEDAIVRRTVLIRTILKLSSDERNSRLLLSSMLVNEDLSIPESVIWIHADYQRELKEFEKHNLNHLVRFYTTRFDAFKCLCFSKDFECETLDLLQFLRIMVKYVKCYPDAKFEIEINLQLKNYVKNDLISEMLSDHNNWMQLANKLDFLDENLEKYWQRNIRTVLDKEGIETIRGEYEGIVYSRVKEKLNEWTNSKGANEVERFRAVDNLLITWYFFCKKFEYIMFNDNRVLNRQASELKAQTKEELGQRELRNAIRRQSLNNKEINGKLYDAQAPSANSKMKTTQKPEQLDNKSDVSVFPIWTMMKKDQEDRTELNINDLTFCDLVQCAATVNTSLKEVFPKHLFSSWMADRVANCMQLCTVIVDEEIAKLIKQIVKMNAKEPLEESYSSVENYFYEALTETVYFFTSLQYWDEQLLERTMDTFCECILAYVMNYKKRLVMRHRSLSGGNKLNLLISVGINELYRLNDTLLNRVLIQMLTDLPADEVWKCIDNYRKAIKQENVRQMNSLVKDQTKGDQQDSPERKANDALIESLNSSTSKLIIKVCFRIKYTFNQIHEHINELVHQLGKQILKQFESSLNEVLNSKKHNLLLKVLNQLEKSLQTLSNHLNNKQSKVDLLIFIKHNLNLNLRVVFMSLVDQYTAESEEKKPDRHLTKIKIIKIITISIKLKEFFKEKSDTFDDNEISKMLEPFLTNFYVDTKEFKSISNKLF